MYALKLGILTPEDDAPEPEPKGDSNVVGSDVALEADRLDDGATAAVTAEGAANREVEDGRAWRVQVRTALEAADGTGGISTASQTSERWLDWSGTKL